MTTIKGDLRQSHQVRETGDGYTVTAALEISGVAAAPDALVYTALQDPGVPKIGDAHPSVPDVVVVDRQGIPRAPDGSLVTLTYAIPEPEDDLRTDPGAWKIEYSGVTQTEEDNRDATGAVMEHQFSDGVSLITHFPRAQVPRPMLRATATRRQTASPRTFIETYRGTVNNATWNGATRYQWLAENIQGARLGVDRAWLVTMSLVFDPRHYGHKFRAVFWVNGREPDYAEEPTDIDLDDGKAIKYHHIYPPVDWTGMGLTLP